MGEKCDTFGALFGIDRGNAMEHMQKNQAGAIHKHRLQFFV